MSQCVAVATRAAAVAGAGMLALAALAACGGDGGEPAGIEPPRTRSHAGDPGPTTTKHSAHHRQTWPTSSARDQGGGATVSDPPSGVRLGEPLRFGALEVRALDYRKAGFTGAATGTRVDVVTVEECATGGSVRVQHRTWRLLDSAGRTLGLAGGKIVNGSPTEDLPESLAAGECRTTRLAIGVPLGSAAVAVQDGPNATWVLAD